MNPRLRFLFLAASTVVVSSATILLMLTLLDQQLGVADVQNFNLHIQTQLHAVANPLLTDFMLALTWLGAIKIFACALALAVVYLITQKRHREAVLLAGGIASAFVLNESLKLHFHRPRPHVPWSIGDEHTFSFPSGHSLFAVVLYATLAYLALGGGGSVWRRLSILLPAILMPAAIGISRIYLGMHYPTDVLAGWLTGAAWLTTIVIIDKTWRVQSLFMTGTQSGSSSHPPSRHP